MSTHMPGFQSFFSFFLHHLVLTKLVSSSGRVKDVYLFYRLCLGKPGVTFHIAGTINHLLKSMRATFLSNRAGIS